MCIRIPTKGRRQLALTAGKTEVRNNNRRGCREKSKKLTREDWLQSSEGEWGRRKEIHVQTDGQEIVGKCWKIEWMQWSRSLQEAREAEVGQDVLSNMSFEVRDTECYSVVTNEGLFLNRSIAIGGSHVLSLVWMLALARAFYSVWLGYQCNKILTSRYPWNVTEKKTGGTDWTWGPADCQKVRIKDSFEVLFPRKA